MHPYVSRNRTGNTKLTAFKMVQATNAKNSRKDNINITTFFRKIQQKQISSSPKTNF